MTGSQAGVVVVGVDGNAASRAALVFALHEGVRRGCAVEVVTAWEFQGPYDGILAPESLEQARENVEWAQDDAVTAALAVVAEPPLLSRVVAEGAAGPVLVQAARHADLLVVGTRRGNLAQRALLGSVSGHCVHHAPTPVVVVPEGVGVRAGTPQSTRHAAAV